MQVRPLFTEFQRLRPKIEAAVKSEELDKAVALFQQLGDTLRPLATILDGVTITRTDEARKLKNVKIWLNHLKYPFDPKWVLEDNALAWIWHSLGTVEEALKSLGRVEDRLVGYKTVEKTFKHGPFVVENRFGYRPEEYEESLTVLDQAAGKIQKAGFGSILYGDIILVTSKQGGIRLGWAGLYRPEQDHIVLNVEAKHRYDDVFTLVHELGHRHWYKGLTGAQRVAYEHLYAQGGGLPLEAREDMWQALVKAEFSPKRAVGYLRDKSLGDTLQAYTKARFDRTPQKELWNTYQKGGAPWMEKNFIRPRDAYVFVERTKVVTVSDYARTNVKEDYAETFAHYVLGMPIPDEVMGRFRLALG